MASGGATGSSTTTVPDYLLPYSQQIAQAGQQIITTPYTAYGGQRVAEPAPLFRQGAEAITNLRASDYAKPAADISAGIATQYSNPQGSFTDSGVASKYMDPFQQNVTDINKRELNRDFGQQTQGFAAKAAQRGTFGGYRNQLGEQELYRNQQQALSDLQTKGQQEAYKSGMSQYNAEQERARAASGLALTAANQASTIGSQNVAEQKGIAEAQQKTGLAEEARRQANLDVDYRNFLEQRDYPKDLINFFNAIIHGIPGETSSNRQNADPLKTTAGIAATLFGATGSP
jgi:hypothetical protein